MLLGGDQDRIVHITLPVKRARKKSKIDLHRQIRYKVKRELLKDLIEYYEEAKLDG
jgi:hypothetical protein